MPKCHGQTLHDSHAEILALRGLNYFLLSEVSRLLDPNTIYSSDFVGPCPSSATIEPDEPDKACSEKGQRPPFAVPSNVSIHMFSTEAPCGDASMEILMAELGPGGSVPWQAPHVYSLVSSRHPAPAISLQGRAFFSDLCKVRRKPSRGDAEPTLSKSCTDKLSVKQISSLLSFPAYHFIARSPNVYLSSLILPALKYSAVSCTRAFSSTGRLSPAQNLSFPGGYDFHAFKVIALPEDFQPQFPFCRPGAIPNPPDQPPLPPTKRKPKAKASNLSALYIHYQSPSKKTTSTSTSTPSLQPPITETLLNGVHQGYSLLSHNPRKASTISRLRMLELGRNTASKILSDTSGEIHHLLEAGLVTELQGLLGAKTYGDAKAQPHGRERRTVKEMVASILPGHDGASVGEWWPRNGGDDEWGVV